MSALLSVAYVCVVSLYCIYQNVHDDGAAGICTITIDQPLSLITHTHARMLNAGAQGFIGLIIFILDKSGMPNEWKEKIELIHMVIFVVSLVFLTVVMVLVTMGKTMAKVKVHPQKPTFILQTFLMSF